MSDSPVPEIRSSLFGYYWNLREHRCRVVEGIRAVAFRNMDHLSAAEKQVGVEAPYSEDDYSKVQDQMLADQRVEQTPVQRWLLANATWMPWEMYICLLYAEIEYYMEVSKKHSSLSYKPLDDFLGSHDAIARSLKDVREKLLHPLKKDVYEEKLTLFMDQANKMAPDFRIAIVEVQHLIDDYLDLLKKAFVESLALEMAELSDEQLLDSSRKDIEAITGRLERSLDIEERRSLEQLLSRQLEFQRFLVENFAPGTEITARQRERLNQWETKRNKLAQPLPKRPYHSNPKELQTPIHRELASFLPDPRGEGQPPWTDQALPDFLEEGRADCLGLLFRSLILFNEPYTDMVVAFERAYPEKSRGEILENDEASWDFVRRMVPLETIDDWRQAELRLSLMIVSTALLSEPLRLYKQATCVTPNLGRQEIDQRINGEALAAFARMRNVIFHVADERTELLETEVAYLEKTSLLDRSYREVIGSLFSFFLRGPAKH